MKRERPIPKEPAMTPLEDGLLHIYTNEDGSMPDFSSLEKPPTSWRRKALWISALFFFLAAATWSGFFFFSRMRSPKTQNLLQLEILTQSVGTIGGASKTLISGAPSLVEIRYANPTAIPIASLSLRVHLPTNFEQTRTDPKPTEAGNTWEIGTLPAHSDGMIQMEGTFIAAVPSQTTIQVFASYRPANFSSTFDEISIADISFETSALGLEITSPETAVPGERVSLQFTLRNKDTHTVKDARVIPKLPSGFLLSKSEPTLESGAWTVPELIGQSDRTFTLEGTFSGSSKGMYDLGGQAELGPVEEHLVQEQVTRVVEVEEGWMNVNLFVNGSTKDQSVSAGDLLSLSVHYENMSGATLENLSATLALTGNKKTLPIHFDSTETTFGNGTRSNASILWKTTDVEGWKRLDKGGQGILDVSLLLLPEPNLATQADEITFTFIIEGRKGKESFRISTTPLVVRLGADWIATSSGRYYKEDGTIVGVGPIPPTRGQATEYEILWSIQTSVHDLTEVSFEIPLAENVEWKDAPILSSGTMTLEAKTNRVRWIIGRVSEVASARFRVALTPSASQVGSTAMLLLPGVVRATDSSTGLPQERALDGLATDLPDDTFADGKGAVVE